MGVGMASVTGLLKLIVRENFGHRRLQRRPEPDLVMESEEAVRAFHEQGRQTLKPIYHYNAVALHQLLPANSAVVDLGSGSAQFLAYLAAARPDLSITGIELSQRMVDTGTRMLADHGVSDRVRLHLGDMAGPWHEGFERIDCVTCIFALHHLPDYDTLLHVLGQIQQARAAYGTGIWIFDHCRPKAWTTARSFPDIFTPGTSPAFREDSTNSLTAAFTYQELRAAIQQQISCTVRARRSLLIPLYQAHWTAAVANVRARKAHPATWVEPRNSREVVHKYRAFRRIMAGVPEWRG